MEQTIEIALATAEAHIERINAQADPEKFQPLELLEVSQETKE